jgi:septal ring factor EnvC (AmiA/AmiB activator)
MEAVAVLDQCGIPRDRLIKEKAEIYGQLAEINRDIRAERKKLTLCREIQSRLPQMEKEIKQIEEHAREVERDERRRR